MKKVLLAAAAAAISMGSFSVQASGEAMYNNLGCAGCHGAGGNSMVPSYPSLAGKDSNWIFQQLKDFQSGKRVDPTMNAMAPMAAGHEQAIADFLSGK
ncbi:MAG: c-type cytochrome [Candidatus Thioglobus sp.]